MYRKFRLRNSLNTVWELTDATIRTFLNSPQGLGYSNSFETIQYGNVLSISKEETAFPVVSGTMLFYQDSIDEKYQSYNDFVNFLSNTPLILEYDVPGVETFYLDVMVQSLSKGEVQTNNMLECPISLQGLGLWRGSQVTSSSNNGTLTLVNNGQIPCGMEITLTGLLGNPYFTLSQNNEVYGEAKFESGTPFDSVYVNSKDAEQNVVLMQDDAVLPNPLGYQDLTISNGAIYVTFIKLAKGTSTLEVGVESGSISTVRVVYSPMYRSV